MNLFHRTRVISLAALAGFVLSTVGLSAQARPAKFPQQRPNDPLFMYQWGLERIKAPQAWRFADGSGAVVAVLDTGADVHHPDLRANLVVYKSANFYDPDVGNGPDDDARYPLHPSGTAVASVISARTDNRLGMAGVAPGAKVMPVRIAGRMWGTDGMLTKGIRYAADHGADVIVIASGFPPNPERWQIPPSDELPLAVNEAIDYAWEKGAFVVAGSGDQEDPGHEYMPTFIPNAQFVYGLLRDQPKPLCSDPTIVTEHLVCVGGTTRDDVLGSYSNFGINSSRPYMVAPGGESKQGAYGCANAIIAAARWRASRQASACSVQSGFDAISSTRLAAGFVGGVAALLVEQGLTNEEIVARLTSTAQDLGVPGYDPIYGYGRVNALKAVQATK